MGGINHVVSFQWHIKYLQIYLHITHHYQIELNLLYTDTCFAYTVHNHPQCLFLHYLFVCICLQFADTLVYIGTVY